jgi:hypothetical protein
MVHPIYELAERRKSNHGFQEKLLQTKFERTIQRSDSDISKPGENELQALMREAPVIRVTLVVGRMRINPLSMVVI